MIACHLDASDVRFGETSRLRLQSGMQDMTVGSFETSTPLYQTARRHISEDLNLQQHHRQNLSSHIIEHCYKMRSTATGLAVILFFVFEASRLTLCPVQWSVSKQTRKNQSCLVGWLVNSHFRSIYQEQNLCSFEKSKNNLHVLKESGWGDVAVFCLDTM